MIEGPTSLAALGIRSEGNTVKFKNTATIGVFSFAAVLALSACSGGGSNSTSTSGSTTPSIDYSTLSGTITAGGSTAQANAEAAWITAFTAQAGGVTINYDKSQGSGGGVTNWLAGSYDFAGSDAYLKPDQQASAQALCGPGGSVNLPVYLDGVSIVYNLPGVSKLNLSSETVAKIFALTITSWNDPAIVADNPGVTLPATPITTVTRSDGSGTTQTFSTYLSEVAPTIWTSPASNTWPIAGSSAQKGGSGVVQAVTAGAGTIGYADHSAIGSLSSAAIGSGKDFVTFSQDAVTAAFAQAATPADTGVKGDLAQKIDYTTLTSADVYPIPLVSYQIVCTTFKDPAQAKLTTAYLGFVASEIGQAVAAKNAGAAKVPADLLAQIQDTLKTVK